MSLIIFCQYKDFKKSSNYIPCITFEKIAIKTTFNL